MLTAAAGGIDAAAILAPQITDLATTSAVVIGSAVALGFAILGVKRGVSWIKGFAK